MKKMIAQEEFEVVSDPALRLKLVSVSLVPSTTQAQIVSHQVSES